MGAPLSAVSATARASRALIGRWADGEPMADPALLRPAPGLAEEIRPAIG